MHLAGRSVSISFIGSYFSQTCGNSAHMWHDDSLSIEQPESHLDGAIHLDWFILLCRRLEAPLVQRFRRFLFQVQSQSVNHPDVRCVSCFVHISGLCHRALEPRLPRFLRVLGFDFVNRTGAEIPGPNWYTLSEVPVSAGDVADAELRHSNSIPLASAGLPFSRPGSKRHLRIASRTALLSASPLCSTSSTLDGSRSQRTDQPTPVGRLASPV